MHFAIIQTLSLAVFLASTQALPAPAVSSAKATTKPSTSSRVSTVHPSTFSALTSSKSSASVPRKSSSSAASGSSSTPLVHVSSSSSLSSFFSAASSASSSVASNPSSSSTILSVDPSSSISSAGAASSSSGSPSSSSSSSSGPTRSEPVSCPVKSPSGSSTEGNSTSAIERRAVRTLDHSEHPSAKQPVTLFHGTSWRLSEKLREDGIQLSDTRVVGDFHHRPFVPGESGPTDGGFYLTDSFVAAAQFVCYGKGTSETSAYVLQYDWTPQASGDVFEFTSESEDWKKFTEYNINGCEAQKTYDQWLTDHTMITGPMKFGADEGRLTSEFWQYAVIHQKAVSSLKLVKMYEVECEVVEKADLFMPDQYRSSQKANTRFSKTLTDYGAKEKSLA